MNLPIVGGYEYLAPQHAGSDFVSFQSHEHGQLYVYLMNGVKLGSALKVINHLNDRCDLRVWSGTLKCKV